jgi:membrane-bound lytic murein transglycosylase D
MLPAETRSYVPTFLAIVYVMHYHNDYKLVSAEPKRELYAVDTVMIQGKVSLKHIAQTLGMPTDELQFLNPCLKYGIVPSLPNGYPLNIPINYFATFESRKEIVMNDPDMTAQAATNEGYANPTMVRVAKYVWYKVRKGETLAGIAARYGVGLSEIREWNHLKNNYIAKGQSLKILTFPEVPVYQAPPQVAVPAAQHIYVADSSGVGSTNSAIPDTSEKVLYYYEKGEGANGEKPISQPAAPTSGTKPATQSTQSRSAIAPISAAIKYYKVQSGDSLWSITQHYPGLTIDKLKSDNNLSGKNLLKGQVLKIVL